MKLAGVLGFLILSAAALLAWPYQVDALLSNALMTFPVGALSTFILIWITIREFARFVDEPDAGLEPVDDELVPARVPDPLTTNQGRPRGNGQ